MLAKHCEVVCNKDKLSVDIQQTIREYKTIKYWAYILHDKDDTAPHYHIYLNFGTSSVDFEQVAKWFKLESNFVSKVKGRKMDMLKYLIHANDTQLHKHQYDIKEVVANFDVGTEIVKSKILGDFENYSFAQQLQYVDSLPIGEKVSAMNQLKKLWEIRCKILSLNSDRKINVLFFCGKSGTGKTYHAKKFLEKKNIDYCVSSSSNDPFQDYMGQKAIILDDLRDEVFDFVDLLKILDNNTSSSAKSRFNNKVFIGDYIIITSSKPPKFWFKDLRLQGSEDLSQFYRRINYYVEVQKDFIYYYSGLDEKGNPKGDPILYINDLKDILQSKQEENNLTLFDGVFDKVCESYKDIFELAIINEKF